MRPTRRDRPPLDREQADEQPPHPYDTSGHPGERDRHITDAEALAATVPDKLTVPLGQVEQQLDRLAGDTPSATPCAIRRLEHIIPETGRTTAYDAETDTRSGTPTGPGHRLPQEEARRRLPPPDRYPPLHGPPPRLPQQARPPPHRRPRTARTRPGTTARSEYRREALPGPLTESLQLPRDLDLALGNRSRALQQLKINEAAHSSFVTQVHQHLPQQEAALLVNARQRPLLASRMYDLDRNNVPIGRHLAASPTATPPGATPHPPKPPPACGSPPRSTSPCPPGPALPPPQPDPTRPPGPPHPPAPRPRPGPQFPHTARPPRPLARTRTADPYRPGRRTSTRQAATATPTTATGGRGPARRGRAQWRERKQRPAAQPQETGGFPAPQLPGTRLFHRTAPFRRSRSEALPAV